MSTIAATQQTWQPWFVGVKYNLESEIKDIETSAKNLE